MDSLYAIADAITTFMNDGPGIVTVFVLGALTAIPVVLVHELGHALVARRRLGGDVKIQVGTTGRIASLRLRQVELHLNALARPDRASGVAEFDASRATARDVVFIALAGPVASLLGTLITGWWLSVTSPGLLHDALWCMTGTGVFGVLNLVPMTLEERDGRRLRTDGGLMLDAIRIGQTARA